MTSAEALAASQTKPIGFIKGSNGIEGFYGRVYFRGQVHNVRAGGGEWNYNTRAQAGTAAKRFAAALMEQARRPAA